MREVSPRKPGPGRAFRAPRAASSPYTRHISASKPHHSRVHRAASITCCCVAGSYSLAVVLGKWALFYPALEICKNQDPSWSSHSPINCLPTSERFACKMKCGTIQRIETLFKVWDGSVGLDYPPGPGLASCVLCRGSSAPIAHTNFVSTQGSIACDIVVCRGL